MYYVLFNVLYIIIFNLKSFKFNFYIVYFLIIKIKNYLLVYKTLNNTLN
jgi:hypothetical protein